MTAMLQLLLLIDSLVHLHFLVQRPAGSHGNSSVQPLMCSLVQLLVYPLWHCLDLFHHRVQLLGTQGSAYSMSLGCSLCTSPPFQEVVTRSALLFTKAIEQSPLLSPQLCYLGSFSLNPLPVAQPQHPLEDYFPVDLPQHLLEDYLLEALLRLVPVHSPVPLDSAILALGHLSYRPKAFRYSAVSPFTRRRCLSPTSSKRNLKLPLPRSGLGPGCWCRIRLTVLTTQLDCAGPP